MRYSRKGSAFRVTRITGPTHNLLGLRFGDRELDALPAVCDLAPTDAPSHSTPLDAVGVRNAVLAGIRRAQALLGTPLNVTHIEYLRNDSGPEAIYEDLAEALALRFGRGEEFTDRGE